MVDVTLIVVTYESAELLPAFCGRLADALAGVAATRVVIVDNASTDQTVAAARQMTPVDAVIDLDTNRGFAAGINAGIAANPDSGAYLILNPDVLLDPGAVAALLVGLTSDHSGIIVPRLYDEHGELLLSLRRRPTLSRALGEAVLGRSAGRLPAFGETVHGAWRYRDRTTADWATGGAMLISAACLARTGPWDESFFLYEEEVEFALRAQDAGFCLQLQPEATATRIIGDEPPSDLIWSLNRINKLRLFARRHASGSTGLFWLVLVLAEAIRIPKADTRHRSALRNLLLPFHFIDRAILPRIQQTPQRLTRDAPAR